MDVEQRAREIFAQWHADKGCGPRVVRDCRNGTIHMDALTSELLRMALTPPEGYVLVPVDLLRLVVGCAYPVSTEINPRGYAWSEAYLDKVLPSVKAALADARPEVPDGRG